MPSHTGERKRLKAWGLIIDEQGYDLLPELEDMDDTWRWRRNGVNIDMSSELVVYG
jgi:hypothetical protein